MPTVLIISIVKPTPFRHLSNLIPHHTHDREIGEEATLREMQVQDSCSVSAILFEKVICVGDAEYTCIPGEVQKHFQSCGTVSRMRNFDRQVGSTKRICLRGVC
ncbi:hypothetical protein PVL29_012724 [Vitis rotundifolia]|uniref:Uncharacterized protein n=1 Tax=Vitis rotundifolia TaxID=103349 RepID=A0AA38ZJH3_VITRO|nr:hypothetical protein PVL29_012724 [Vitis rotundifolia]